MIYISFPHYVKLKEIKTIDNLTIGFKVKLNYQTCMSVTKKKN